MKCDKPSSTTDSHPWQILPKETSLNYEAFCQYLDLGPQRSISALKKKLGRSDSLLERWSSKFDWLNRARAYDIYLREKEEQHRETLLKKSAIDWAKRYEEQREQEWAASQALFAKAVSFLKQPYHDLTMRDVINMLQIASKLARRATGLNEKEGLPPAPETNTLNEEFLRALEIAYGKPQSPANDNYPQ